MPQACRTKADLPRPGWVLSIHTVYGAVRLPPKTRRAPCELSHAPDNRYVLAQAGPGRHVWLCYACVKLAPVQAALIYWRQDAARQSILRRRRVA